MARGSDLLTAMKTKAAKEPVFYLDGKALTAPGHYRDGKGLYLQISVWGTKSFVFRYTINGKMRGMGLGSIEDVSLAEARNEVERLRVIVREGRDPIEERRAKKVVPDAPKVVTFADALNEYMKTDYITKTLSSDKHRKQWRASLDLHVIPKMGTKDVATITIDDVKEVLKPIWATKTDTARRVRQRVESVFAWAIDEGCREHDNPASVNVLQIWIKNQKKADKNNHPAIQQDEMSAWFADLGKRDGTAAQGYRIWILDTHGRERTRNETCSLIAFGGCESRFSRAARRVSSKCDSPGRRRGRWNLSPYAPAVAAKFAARRGNSSPI